MKQRSRLALVAGFGALLLSASCVSQARYDEALRTSQHYQGLYHGLQQFQPQLEAENQRLMAQLEGVNLQDASYTREIDERMAELDEFLKSLGAAADDVARFEIEGGYGYSLRDAVLFDLGSATVRDDGKALLGKLAEEIKKNAYDRIWIRGHTDDLPIVKAETKKRYPLGNLQLSADRALQVAGYLMKEGGIDEKRLVVAGHGESEPVLPNDSAEHRQRNRRVEILVFEDQGDAAPAPAAATPAKRGE